VRGLKTEFAEVSWGNNVNMVQGEDHNNGGLDFGEERRGGEVRRVGRVVGLSV